VPEDTRTGHDLYTLRLALPEADRIVDAACEPARSGPALLDQRH